MTRIAIASLILLLALPGKAADKDKWLAVGKPFPLVSLPLAGNEERRDSVERYRGRKLMVHCFASW